MVFFSPTVFVAALKLATNTLSIRSDDSASNTTNSVDTVDSNTFEVDGGFQDEITGAANNTLSDDGDTPTSDLPISPASLGDPAYNGTWLANITAFADSNCTPQTYSAPPMPEITLPGPNPALATVYRYRQQQGVNLGSWFMLEGWMVQSLFSCATAPAISEIDVATGWNGQAKQVLEKHWDSFITESDFIWMAGLGINTVRLPLGYWHIGTGEQEWTTGTLYEGVRDQYVGAWPRVLRAVSLAEKYGIGVLIDLHGAPGSQNGQQHSGVSDGQTNLFSSPSNMQKTISVLQFLTRTFMHVPNIVGIQLLNEPTNIPEVFDFYTNALNTLRSSDPAAQSFPFYIHDAFDLNKGADFVRSRGREWNVLDHHSYYVFTPYDNSESATSHTTDLSLAGSVGSALMEAGMGLNGNLIIGEWSCALSDESLSGEESPISSRRQFCEVQEQTYRDVGAGAAFWSLTKENCEQDPAWCFKSAVGNSLPSSFFSYEGLLVSNDLNAVVGAAATSQGNPNGGEGGRPQSNSPGIQPSTRAAVTSMSHGSTISAATIVSSDTASIPATSTSDSASPTSNPAAMEILTTLESGLTPSTTTADTSPDSTQLSTQTPPDMSSTPSTFVPMRRSVDWKSIQLDIEARGQLPPPPEILSHAGRPDADGPVGIMNIATMNVGHSSPAHSCSPKSVATLPHGVNRPSGARRRWSTREHRVVSIHKRRTTNVQKLRRDEVVSTAESTRPLPGTVPTTQDANSQDSDTNAAIADTLSTPHTTLLSNTQVLANGTILYTSQAPQLTLAQQAIQRGFSDGFMTAKMFAQQGPGMSRLGFKWQYVEDSLSAHGSNVAPGKEGYYREWFEKGLTQGEVMVAQIIARMNA